jgi:hypothetical protein
MVYANTKRQLDIRLYDTQKNRAVPPELLMPLSHESAGHKSAAEDSVIPITGREDRRSSLA